MSMFAKLRVVQRPEGEILPVVYWLEAHETGWISPEQPEQARVVNRLFPIEPRPDDPRGMAAVERCAAELQKLAVVQMFVEPDESEAEPDGEVPY